MREQWTKRRKLRDIPHISQLLLSIMLNHMFWLQITSTNLCSLSLRDHKNLKDISKMSALNSSSQLTAVTKMLLLTKTKRWKMKVSLRAKTLMTMLLIQSNPEISKILTKHYSLLTTKSSKFWKSRNSKAPALMYNRFQWMSLTLSFSRQTLTELSDCTQSTMITLRIIKSQFSSQMNS